MTALVLHRVNIQTQACNLQFLRSQEDDETIIPNDVVEAMVMNGHSIVKAWRNYKKLSQKDVAGKMGITQAAFSQMEQLDANLRKDTIQKIADALGIRFEQIFDI